MPKHRILLLLMLAVTPVCNAADSAQPTLFWAVGEPNGLITWAQEVNLPCSDGLKIVIATHGWFEREPWPADLALAIRNKVDPNQWLCGWLDWRNEARSFKLISSRAAAQYARDTVGPLLAEQILKLSKDPNHIHLIGHSAGCWAISEAAKIIAKQTQANIHLTFLDAYVPIGWDANALGDTTADPNRTYWADHYLTQDITLKVTNCALAHAHNVDIGDVTPGLKDHEFPRYWYPATVLGKYAPGDRYDGKKLYTKTETIEYGFSRSLEAGQTNWQQSLKLPVNNQAIKINKGK